MLRTCGAGFFSREKKLGPSRRVDGRGGHCSQWPVDGSVASGGSSGHTSRRSGWCPNGCIRPVLKHGPRSATCSRVSGWQARGRSESGGEAFVPAVARAPLFFRRGRIVDRSRATPWRDLSESVPVATRKMVNYA